MRRPRRVLAGLIAASVVVLAGCPAEPDPSPTRWPRFDVTLRVLSTSELADMPPLLEQLREDTGITLRLEPMNPPIGTLAATELLLKNPGQYDLAWLPTANYLALLLEPGDARRPLGTEPTMSSPVVLGVKTSVAQRFGWSAQSKVGWADIAAKAKAGQLRFAMTDPSQSNSGFSAMVGAATAFSGSGGAALRADRIDQGMLASFLTGHELRAPTSGLLKDEYLKAQDRLDGMLNYESVLLELNADARLTDKFQLVYPSEGVVTADYPLLLLKPEHRAAYQTAVDWLTSPGVQQRIRDTTHRRPFRPDVPFPGPAVTSVPFPATFDTCKALFSVYQNLGRPSHIIYALDVSGSMEGKRLEQLRQAFAGLTGGDTSLAGQFSHFRRNERVTLIPFAEQVLDQREFTITDPAPDSPGYAAIRSYVDGLRADGWTAVYSAADRAYQRAAAAVSAGDGHLITVVILTDGENNRGISADEFLTRLRALPEAVQRIRTFAILFGEARPEELRVITERTGGTLIDANATSLAEAFKTIRGYQ